MIAVELPQREPWPRWRVLSFAAALSTLARVSPGLYLETLYASIRTGSLGGTIGEA